MQLGEVRHREIARSASSAKKIARIDPGNFWQSLAALAILRRFELTGFGRFGSGFLLCSNFIGPENVLKEISAGQPQETAGIRIEKEIHKVSEAAQETFKSAHRTNLSGHRRYPYIQSEYAMQLANPELLDQKQLIFPIGRGVEGPLLSNAKFGHDRSSLSNRGQRLITTNDPASAAIAPTILKPPTTRHSHRVPSIKACSGSSTLHVDQAHSFPRKMTIPISERTRVLSLRK